MRPILCMLLSTLFIVTPTFHRGLSDATVSASQRPTDITIQDYLQRSYLDLFEIAPELNVTAADAKQIERWLRDARKTCVKRFEKQEDVYKHELKEARKRLRLWCGR